MKENENIIAEIQVQCNPDMMLIKMSTNKPFNGMIYPNGLLSASSCIAEFDSSTNMSFKLPLKSCNTIATDVEDGVEYSNTIVVQPHHRLLTSAGRGYHVKCKYQTRERTITNSQFNVTSSFATVHSNLERNNVIGGVLGNTPSLAGSALMPTCTMKIYRSATRDAGNTNEDGGENHSSATVKVGDKLIMVIEIDRQDMYGMRITSCVVRDGLNLAEQLLIDERGCPLDSSIMPKFEYSLNSTRAAVSFPAHKFPHTPSIYYQCNVRLCIKSGGCEQPACTTTNTLTNNNASNHQTMARSKRGTGSHNQRQQVQLEVQPSSINKLELAAFAGPMASKLRSNKQLSFDVYSKLYVSDNKNQLDDDSNNEEEPGDTVRRSSIVSSTIYEPRMQESNFDLSFLAKRYEAKKYQLIGLLSLSMIGLIGVIIIAVTCKRSSSLKPNRRENNSIVS